MHSDSMEKSIVGAIFGTAVGDAVGLSMEGMSRRRLRRMFKDIGRYRFFFGRGMLSDDTEHTCMVAQSLAVSGGDEKKFTGSLGWRLRFWLLGLPAGIGFATLRSLIKLWLGFPARMSGVFSAGNGPAMRSAVIGAYCGEDKAKIRALARAQTRITHTDPKAEYGAFAVALAASLAAGSNGKEIGPDTFLDELKKALEGEDAAEFIGLMENTARSAAGGESTEKFADSLGLEKGVTGYMYHTVPVAIHCWLKNQFDLRSGIIEIVNLGGDTDTTAAILGGIIGAGVGADGIPREWLDGLMEWPRTVKWMRNLGLKLAESARSGKPRKPPRLFFPAVLLRNIFFMIVVLAHGFRRALPPY